MTEIPEHLLKRAAEARRRASGMPTAPRMCLGPPTCSVDNAGRWEHQYPCDHYSPPWTHEQQVEDLQNHVREVLLQRSSPAARPEPRDPFTPRHPVPRARISPFVWAIGVMVAAIAGLSAFMFAKDDYVSPKERMDSGVCTEILDGIEDAGRDAGLAQYGRIKYEQAGCINP
jgi:hypothetical protein